MEMTVVTGQVGLQQVGDGATIPLRQGKGADLIVSELRGRYHESASRGRLFVLDSDAITLAAANATKSALGTVKFLTGFYNPPTSGVIASILYACVATTSGTPAGPYFFNGLACPAVTSAATGTIRPTNFSAVSSAMTPQVNVAVVVSGAATTALAQIATLGGPAAVAATGVVLSVAEEVAGRIVVPPGVVFGILAAGAGTSHIIQSSLYWEELPV